MTKKSGAVVKVDLETLWTVRDVAAYLQVTEPTVRKMAKENRIPAYRLNERLWRFRQSEIVAWFDAKKTGKDGVHNVQPG